MLGLAETIFQRAQIGFGQSKKWENDKKFKI
jgi:hypothetical protein